MLWISGKRGADRCKFGHLRGGDDFPRRSAGSRHCTVMRPARAASPPEPDDPAWVARAVAGDPAAFRALFEHHAPAVRRFLRDLGRDPAWADEATQETFVRAHGRLASLRDGERVRPWLLGIARRVFLEELRRRRSRVAADLDALDAAVIGTIAPGVLDASPQDDLLIAEQARVFRAAIGQLGAERRGVLLLRVDHDLTYDEIAQVMGLSTAQVRNELHRARLELRAILTPYVEDRS
jgi:RNA polymerase sigma-70 factor (ECF subfamily)